MMLVDSSKWTGRHQNKTSLIFDGGGGVAFEEGDIITIEGIKGHHVVSKLNYTEMTIKPCSWYLRLWWWVKHVFYKLFVPTEKDLK